MHNKELLGSYELIYLDKVAIAHKTLFISKIEMKGGRGCTHKRISYIFLCLINQRPNNMG